MQPRTSGFLLATAFVLSLFTVLPLQAQPAGAALLRDLGAVAPTLDRKVLRKAVAAMECAVSSGVAPSERLAVIDFSRPSTEPRLWIFDLHERTLVLEELVAHGQGSGDDVAQTFSNVRGSHQSSIGLFRTQESYYGQHGYSLRMDGLESGVNDRARERAIVIHGADYVNNGWIERYGRLGRSHGCPAVSREVADVVVDSLKEGQFLFSYYPDPEWLASSDYLNCPAGQRLAALDI